MTSIASSKGDVGAEMLASQIGAYFDLAIRIIEFHGGDVVKVYPSFLSLAHSYSFRSQLSTSCCANKTFVLLT